MVEGSNPSGPTILEGNSSNTPFFRGEVLPVNSRHKLEIDWGAFEKWCFQRVSRQYAKDVYNYALKYHRLLWKGLQGLHELPARKRRHILEALANLSKFLGCHPYFKQLREASGVKWAKPGSLQTFIKIYEKPQDLEGWLLEAKEKLPWKYYFPIAFTALTGLRAGEALASLNLIAEGRLPEYYNSDLGCLEHFRFPEVFLRRNKNAYISFVSSRLLGCLESWREKASWDMLRCKLRRVELKTRLHDLRAYWATLQRERGLPTEAIDLLQGRISSSIFARHYYKPYLKALRRKVLATLKPLEAKLLN